ncbi:MAG: VOC family protein [Vitreoscilla sp.]|nr:VOC family protein [Vitreoscilla sp.]
MNPTPPDWPRISSSLVCQDPAAMIDWLCRAFGFQLRLKVEGEDGRIEHSELCYGEGVVMVCGESGPGAPRFGTPLLSPRAAGGNTQSMMVYVDDADAHCAQARAAGARIVAEPALHDYGEAYWADRSYGAIDPEGHLWWITQRIRSAP